MVQIDDAGSGSLVGGTCIGLYYDKTNSFKFDFIPLTLYSPEKYKKKLYQQYVIDIVKKFFDELSIPKDEPIKVCQGYIFDDLREYFKQKKLNWTNTKIEGPLQDKVEKTFSNYAISLGLPSTYVKYTRYPFHFHKLLRWVYAEYSTRKNLCKTGWKSWQRYGYLKPETSYGSMVVPGYFCLRCGEKIKEKSPIKILKFTSNKPNILYLHKNCQN